MTVYDFFVLLLGICAAAHAIPYGIYEFKNKNKMSAIIIYMIALIGITLSILQCYFQK